MQCLGLEPIEVLSDHAARLAAPSIMSGDRAYSACSAMRWRVLSGAIVVLLGLAFLPASNARAQETGQGAGRAGIMAPGDAVVTGFSGIKAPDAPVPKDSDPLDAFHIDLDGPSAQIFQLGVPEAPAQGQLISVPAPYKARARDVGQVFPIALDDSPVPSIYVGQSSAFGLQIVGPDGNGDGRPDRLKQGGPQAQWMPGQFGTDTGGGPGSIYRIDGRTGVVSVFATIPGNGGAGLGDIVFDKASRQFLVSDLDTGLIHRLDMSGAVLDRFDHGTAGRTGAGLPPEPDDGAQADIKDAGFSVEEPGTWGFTPKARLVWGMAVHDGRLYYAAAEGPAIWSVGLRADGGFAGDAREELQVADTPAGNAVSDIAFDGQGRMYLAQRGAIRGSYDYSAFAEAEQSVVRRYRREPAADPATPAAWVPDEYAVGFPAGHRNAAGGIALGYAYDETGSIRRGACGGTLWSTGDALRNDEKLAEKLADEGPLDVHGLQGNAVALVRPQNEPPSQSYFVDYDGQFGDLAKAGHVGDVEIWQPCEGSPGFTGLYPGYPPPGFVWPGDWPPPGDWIPPPPPGKWPTNLKVDKKPLFCWDMGGKHRCLYRITVTNTGPGIYHDHIVVRDTIPNVPGVKATFLSAKFDACPGGPPAYNCTTKAPVHLLPWEQVAIAVRVDVPDDQAKPLGCRVRNRVRILHAPSPSNLNTNPADDADSATALLPAHLCEEPPKTNLRLTNTAGECVPIGGGEKFKCSFTVRVWNMGPGLFYKGKIDVTDTVPNGTTANFAGGWNCPGPGLGPSYLCKHNPVVLGLIQAVQLKVSVNVSAHRAKELGCKVTNTAKIDFAPGGSDKNANPGDDQASATATVPGVCDPPAVKSNLALHMGRYGGAQSPECPLIGNATWCRRFRVVVENTGPDTFKGPVKVLNVPLGLPVKVGFAPGAQWTCNAATRICQTNGNLVLPKDGISPVFNVHVSGDDNDAKAMNCKLKNVGEIVSPQGPPKNVKKADDMDEASYDLPAELCDQPQAKTNLKVNVATAPGCPPAAGATWCRAFSVSLRNTGPGSFTGKIKVANMLPPGVSTIRLIPVPWGCGVVGGTITCDTSNFNVQLPKNGISQVVTVKVSGDDDTAKALNCKLKLAAEILSPEGAPNNTEAADDKDAASHDLPAELCDQTSDVQQCPPGFQWVGDRCGPVIVPPRGCPAGTVGRYPDCRKPPVGIDPPVVIDPPRVCPPGTVGRPPYCRVVEPVRCPPGMVGTPPSCRRILPLRCPTGTVGVPPNCRVIEPVRCPPGMVGRPPNCRRIEPAKCPPGMVGQPPSCRPRILQLRPGLLRRAAPSRPGR